MQYDCDLDVVKTSYPAQSTSRLYTEIAKEIAALWQQPELFNFIDDALRGSEAEHSYVIEGNVMICNAKVIGIDRPVHMLYRLAEGIQMDERSVDLVFVLLSPETDGPFHLRRLSRITRLMGDSVFCERLREAGDKDSIRAQFMYPDLDEEAA